MRGRKNPRRERIDLKKRERRCQWFSEKVSVDFHGARAFDISGGDQFCNCREIARGRTIVDERRHVSANETMHACQRRRRAERREQIDRLARAQHFDREHVLMIWTSPSQGGRKGAALADLFKTAQERISSLLGVLSASPSDSGLLNGNGGSPVKVPGYTRRSSDDYFVAWKLVAPRFFDTVGMRLVAGRDFTALDTEKSPPSGDHQ